MKRAQLQIQFNWIFVIVIGSIFLLFFFAIINQQSKSTDERISISQSKYFETVITATGQKVGTLKEYDIPNLEVEFECDAQKNLYGYSVENLPARDTKYDIIFTQEKLVGDDVQTWTQIWEVPFKAASFLYITNSNQGYIFYNISDVDPEVSFSSTDFEILYDGFPKNISTELISSDLSFGKVSKRNYESNTYVFLYGEEPKISDLEFNSKAKNTIVVLQKGEGARSLFDYGKAYNFTPEGYIRLLGELGNSPSEEDLLFAYEDKDPAGYLGKASLYGTIFSGDKDIYECNMEKAFSRLQLVTRLYYLRVFDFTDDNSFYADLLTIDCKNALGYYDDGTGGGVNADHPFWRLSYLSEVILANGYSADTVEEVYDSLFDLNDNNKNIARLANCPLIY